MLTVQKEAFQSNRRKKAHLNDVSTHDVNIKDELIVGMPTL